MAIDRGKVVGMVKRLSREYPEFAKSLMQWVPFLCSSTNRVSWATGRSDEDVLQDILVGVSEINLIYNIPLYRYKGRVYEKLKEYGSLTLLQTPRNNKSRRRQLWVEDASLEPIEKSKLESTIYREIFQQSADLLKAHFTPRNGYKRCKKEDQAVAVRSGRETTSLQRKEVQEVVSRVRLVSEVDSEDLNNIVGTQNLEEGLVFKQYVEQIKDNVSDTASDVLDVLVSYPGVPVYAIAEYLDVHIDKVHLAKIEIIRNLPFDSERISKISSAGRLPVFMSVD